MDLLEKFSVVKIRPMDCMTGADRQFCQRQQDAYQDAAQGFYQIAALWTDMCACQKKVLSKPEDLDDEWKQKYLVSECWPKITVGAIMEHLSLLHREFIFTVVSYLNDTYHLTIEAGDVTNGLHMEKFCYAKYEDTVDWSTLTPVILCYEDIIALILSRFNGRTFEEQAPYELVDRCHRAAWREKDHQANFEQKKSLVKIFSGACNYGYYSGHEQWHIYADAKNILKALAYFETGAFDQYPDGIDDLLFEDGYLWYDLWEFEDCEKLEKIRLFKNGRMDIRFTNEGYAREFVSDYLGTIW